MEGWKDGRMEGWKGKILNRDYQERQEKKEGMEGWKNGINKIGDTVKFWILLIA